VQHIGITLDGEGFGIFYSILTGLTPNTTCFVRSYAINSSGTSYGQLQTFTAGSTPVVDFIGSPTTATEVKSCSSQINRLMTQQAGVEIFIYHYGPTKIIKHKKEGVTPRRFHTNVVSL